MFTSVAVHWLPGMIKTFQNEYQNIAFELLHGDYTEIENWILEDRVDFGFLRLYVNIGLYRSNSKDEILYPCLPSYFIIRAL